MDKKYTLKQQSTKPADSQCNSPQQFKSRKGVIVVLSLLCVLLLGGGLYMFHSMSSQVTTLNKELNQIEEKLTKSEAEIAKVEADLANYKRLKDYYAPFEKMFDVLLARVKPSEIKEVSTLLQECVSDSVYYEQIKKWESWQKESVLDSIVKPGSDLGLYAEWNSDGTISATDRVVDKALENREKGINPSN